MKRITTSLVFCFLTLGLFAQQVNYNWRLGASVGYTNYYGDLSPYEIGGFDNIEKVFKLFTYNGHYYDKPSGQISLETRITPTTGIMLHYGQYHFGQSDRFINPDGSLDLNAPNFDRALNFQTTLRDIGLSLVFKTDNGKILKEKSFIAPYLTLGGGWRWFDVYGDLLDENNAPYDYTSTTVTNDGTFETDLSAIETEVNGNYDQSGVFASLGIGIRFRLTNRLELFAQSDFKHVFTDHLDDVSGQYKEEYPSSFEAYAAKPGTNTVDPANPFRGNSNGQKDWYIYHGAGIKFSFGAGKSHFSAPVVSTSYRQATSPQVPTEQAPAQEKTSQEATAPNLPVTNNYYTFLNWPSAPNWEQIKHQLGVLLIDMEIAEQNQLLEKVKSAQAETERELQAFRISNQELSSDSVANNERKELMEINLQKSDSLSQEAKEIQSRIIALEKQKSMLPLPSGNDSTFFDMENKLALPSLIPEDKAQEGQSSRALVFQQAPIDADSLMKSDTTFIQEPEEEKQLAKAAPVTEDPTVEKESKEGRQSSEPLLAVVETAPTKDNEEDQRTERSTESLATLPEEQEITVKEKRRSGFLPIPIIFPKFKKKKQEPEEKQLTTADTLQDEKAAPWFDNISQEEYETYYRPAVVLGMSLAGIPATTEADTSQSTEPLLEMDTTPEMEARVEEPVPVTKDTVFVEGKESIILLPSKTAVYFDLNQQKLSDAEKEKLSPLINYLKEHPTTTILLEGFADNTGNLSYNLRLIEARTNEVKRVLIEEFSVSPEKIKTGSGGQIVRDPNKNIPNEMDRRVELSIILE
ncbi:hypothetical protein GCM10028791_31240 [Echinicola sediminis]